MSEKMVPNKLHAVISAYLDSEVVYSRGALLNKVNGRGGGATLKFLHRSVQQLNMRPGADTKFHL